MYPIHTWFALERLRRGNKVDETADVTVERDASWQGPPESDADASGMAETTETAS
jgi:hypothetical protein